MHGAFVFANDFVMVGCVWGESLYNDIYHNVVIWGVAPHVIFIQGR